MRRKRPGKPSSSDLSAAGTRRASEIVQFFERALRHTKGQWAGAPFRLTAWQREDIITPLFGTLLPDGRRQYRTLFLECGRKNGKSQLAAGIALAMLFLDGEPGAEVLCLASDVDQARVTFGECSRMIAASPEIREAFRPIVYRDSIEYPETGSVLKVLSADEKGIHGRNPSCLILDEVHTFVTTKAREFFAGATTATGTRREPLTVLITTAGYDKASIAFELHQYAAEIRAGTRHDPSFLSVCYAAPEALDWTSREALVAANPALTGPDAFLTFEHFEHELRQARAFPSRQNTFRMLFLNQWTEQSTRWIDMQQWQACTGHAIDVDDLQGRRLFGGLDVSATSDLMPLVWLTPCRHQADAYDVHVRFFLPEQALDKNRNADLYRAWRRAGVLTIAGTDVIDYSQVLHAVGADAARGTVEILKVDARFQGVGLIQALERHGVRVAEMPQTHSAFAAPMTEFERLLQAGLLHHGDHPILTWMAGHAVAKADSNGDLRPDKARAHEKIDGIVALVMAIDGLLRHTPAPTPAYQILFLDDASRAAAPNPWSPLR